MAQTNRLVLIYFCGPSCAYCRRMEAEVLSQPGVAAAINADYVPVKITADDFPTTARRYNVTHLPTTVITLPQGQWVDSKEGYVAAEEYVGRLGKVAFDVKRRREAVLAEMQSGPTPPVVNQPVVNQPVVNQPMANQPMANQPMANQPTWNPPTTSQPPAGQQAFGPPVVTTAPPSSAVPAAVSPPYGGSPYPIISPPMVTQQSPSMGTQQPPPSIQPQSPPIPPQYQQQVAVAPPQNNVASHVLPAIRRLALRAAVRSRWLTNSSGWPAIAVWA